MCAPRPAQAAAYLQATAPEVEPQPDTASGPTLADRQRAFESGSAYQTAAPSTGAKRGTANQEKVKALQKAGIQDDPNKPVSAGNSQHKLAMASLERKKERIESAGSMGKGTTQMSDALKGLAAAQERPTGPSQHQQAMERLSRTSEQKSGDAGAYSGRPKPQIVNSTLDDEVGGNQMQQVRGILNPSTPMAFARSPRPQPPPSAPALSPRPQPPPSPRAGQGGPFPEEPAGGAPQHRQHEGGGDAQAQRQGRGLDQGSLPDQVQVGHAAQRRHGRL